MKLVVYYDMWRKQSDRFRWKYKGTEHRSSKLLEARLFAKHHDYSGIIIGHGVAVKGFRTKGKA